MKYGAVWKLCLVACALAFLDENYWKLVKRKFKHGGVCSESEGI